MKIAINGLGRIGRCVFRALFEEEKYKDLELVAVNGPADIDTHIHLLKYDSVFGRAGFEIKKDGDFIVANGRKIRLTREKDISKLGWKGVDVVMECTGKFNDFESNEQHLKNGAGFVVISAPAKGKGKTVVYGVNHEILTANDKIISVGSCTTNCLAPLAKVLNDEFGIVNGFMTTIHSYTGDQNLTDSSHKDLCRARAAVMSMIPTSTGAANAISLIIPELAGKLDGIAVRVPTPNVSLVDFSFVAERTISVEAINNAIIKASDGKMKGVLAYNNEKLVSIDFNGNPHSSIFDLSQTKVIGNMAKTMAWYDNEWAFSLRMIDIAKILK